MPGVKTNEAPGTRAVLRHYRMSAYKAREVLDLVRGKDADRAEEILNATPREAARVVGKVLASAVANARNNDQLDPDELYVSACYADEGTTLKRWRPRARGRATRIRKRTCHITVIVSRLPEDRLERRRSRQATETSGLRSRRVAASRRGEGAAESVPATTADADTEDLEATSTDVADHGDQVDEVDELDTEGEASADVSEDEEEFQEPEWLDEADVEGATEVESAADVEDVTEVEEEQEALPAPKPRRARVRKATKKAESQTDDSDSGASGDEEKD
jgi:large subunit ribosomal protein L22